MDIIKITRALSLIAIVGALIGLSYRLFGGERPHVLTRLTAARAIESTAQFQHKTKLFFTVSEAEGIIPGACHNFEFSPERMEVVRRYLRTGVMKFSPYRNQTPPFFPASVGSLDLSLRDPDRGLLVDRIDSCKAGQVSNTTGAYELTLGIPVIEINGIRRESNHAFVDFTWHFESLNETGQMLTRIQITRDRETRDERLTAEEKSRAPFWSGSAKLTEYDDGWRVVEMRLSGSGQWWENWDYGPEWPDPDFNWSAFDENENHF